MRLLKTIRNFLKVPSSENKTKTLLCGIGQSNITDHNIQIYNYPFEPSIAYPNRTIKANAITSMAVDFGVCKLFVENDIVFISAEKKDILKKFAQKHNIPLTNHSWNWDWILEPYLETQFTQAHEQRTLKQLQENGISEHEVKTIRNEIGKQMYAYNFDTMLWDWCSLGLADVLAAMRATYNKREFRDFYKRAIDIDTRTKKVTCRRL